ncbi:MAG: hypothetical protein SGJ19_11100 [Planctomycetia bacterium]|nr:hypothetical protein [Planctomycetia bacterium]
MQKREKQLMGVVVALVAVLAGNWLYGKVRSSINARTNEITRLSGDVTKKDNQIKRGKLAATKLAKYESRALPSDPELARAAYSAWLRKIVGEAGFEAPNVEPPTQATPKFLMSANMRTAKGPRPIVYHRLPYSVRGKATLEELTKFLHTFYSAGHLHLVRSLTMTPQESGKLEVKITIDALVLPDADRKDALSSVPGESLAGTFEEYRDVITKRNTFAAYKPAPPKPPEKSSKPDPAVDPARFAKVTAILTDPELVVWIHMETTGKLFKLAEGEEFDLGEERRGKVHRIHLTTRTVELQINDEKKLYGLGDKLTEGKPLGTETAAR